MKSPGARWLIALVITVGLFGWFVSLITPNFPLDPLRTASRDEAIDVAVSSLGMEWPGSEIVVYAADRDVEVVERSWLGHWETRVEIARAGTGWAVPVGHEFSGIVTVQLVIGFLASVTPAVVFLLWTQRS